MADVHVKGLSDLQKFLDEFTPKMEANVMRGGLRAGMNVVKPVAQANIHSVSGELAKGLKVGTRVRKGTVFASLKAKGVHGFVAKFLEFGTKAHRISARFGSLFFRGFFAKSVEHPGATKKPFLRPALDQQATAAVVATAVYIKDRLQTKHGLNTSHVMIEGDE